jgi:hypothetical protein
MRTVMHFCGARVHADQRRALTRSRAIRESRSRIRGASPRREQLVCSALAVRGEC